MSKNYNQLSQEQRYQIEALLRTGAKQREIAIIIGTSPSTISREIRRNTAQRGRGAKVYSALNAQRKTLIRHRQKPKQIRFTEEDKLKAQDWLLQFRYSPELIHIEGKRQYGDFVSHETIYKWIWYCKQSHHRRDIKYQGLYRYLAHRKRRRKRGLRRDSRGLILNRVSIADRPAIVAKRKRLGDFEIDLMMGKNHKGALLVMTDRASLMTRLQLLPSKDSGLVEQGIKKRLRPIRHIVKTLTFDNDQAFSQHIAVGKHLKASTYFTRPYTSQDKGTVENRIGVIRRLFPKKTVLTTISKERIKEVEYLINNRPVRKFNYKTPNQVFSEKIALFS